MSTKSYPVLVSAIFALLFGVFAHLLFFDKGVRFAEAQLAHHAALVDVLGSPLRIWAYRARWTETEHVYGVVVSGQKDWIFTRVRVEYKDGQPQKAEFIDSK